MVFLGGTAHGSEHFWYRQLIIWSLSGRFPSLILITDGWVILAKGKNNARKVLVRNNDVKR